MTQAIAGITVSVDGYITGPDYQVKRAA